eukprot:673464-Pleurochrysis_carterae.AAC.1
MHSSRLAQPLYRLEWPCGVTDPLLSVLCIPGLASDNPEAICKRDMEHSFSERANCAVRNGLDRRPEHARRVAGCQNVRTSIKTRPLLRQRSAFVCS